MVLVNYTTRELTAKVVYYGPGLCGKTTNLQFIFDSLPPDKKGKMISLATKTDRTLFFDFLPLDLGTIKGMRTRIQLYTVPGQVFYNETRKLVLRGADGIVFVADSNRNMMDANLESLQNLEENLREYGIDINDVPLVLQYNKRDLPNIYSVEELDQTLKQRNPAWPSFEAVAIEGTGVHETLKAISKLVLKHLAAKFSSTGVEKPAQTGAMPAAPAAQAPAAPQQQAPTPPPAPEPAAPEPAPMELDIPQEQDTGFSMETSEPEPEPAAVPVEESVSIGGEMSDEEYASFYGGSGVTDPSESSMGSSSEWESDEETLTLDAGGGEEFGASETMDLGGGGSEVEVEDDYSEWVGSGGEDETISLEAEEDSFVLDAGEESAPTFEMTPEPAATEAPAAPAVPAPGPEIQAGPVEIPIPVELAGGQGEISRTVVVPLQFSSPSGTQTIELKVLLQLKPKG